MTTITCQHGIWTGTSDDGRIVYRSCDDGPTIGGRYAWRGHYLKAAGTYTIQDGAVDTNAPVAPTDWAAACLVMQDVDVAVAADREAARQRADDRLERMADAIPDRMVDFFRPDSDL